MVDFKSRPSGNGGGSGEGSSSRSDTTCQKCGKKGHIKIECRSKGNGCGDNPPKKSANELLELVTRNYVVSDTKNIATSTMNYNNKK